MKLKNHDDIIKYLEDKVYQEYKKLIFKDKAVIKTKLEYDIPVDFNRKLHGECDFVYLDFDARSSYIIEVKHDYCSRNREKAKHQIIKDMWAMYEFYTWAFQNGYMAWYYPRYKGKKILTDCNFKIASKYLNEEAMQRLKEYNDFFDYLLNIK